MMTNRTWFAISLCATVVFGSGCEQSPTDIEPVAAGVSTDDRLPTLHERLNNVIVSAEEFGSWRCDSALTDVPVAYVFPSDRPGRYLALHPVTGFESVFDVGTGAVNALELTYGDSGVQESISDIEFTGPDHWSAFSTTDGAIDCERVQVLLPEV